MATNQAFDLLHALCWRDKGVCGTRHPLAGMKEPFSSDRFKGEMGSGPS
jgi:hypothetical protein